MQPQVWRCPVLVVVLVLQLSVVEVRAQAVNSSDLFTCLKSDNCTYIDGIDTKEYFFDVSGKNIRIVFVDGNYYTIICEDSLTLEDPGIPRFKMAVRVKNVKFSKCPPPINRSYAAVLAALNVTAFSGLILDYGPTAVITREHLAGLQQLTRLDLIGNTTDVRLAPGALSALASAPALRDLTLQMVQTPAADLANLPASLQVLKQWSVNTDRVYLNRLPNLTKLYVSEDYNLTLNARNATSLKELYVSSSNTVLSDDALPPTLTTLVLWSWNDTQPASKTNCAQLLNLKISGTGNKSWPVLLPDDWVASCGQLKQLHMYSVPVNGTLPARLLANASALERLTIQKFYLDRLPQGLLDDTPRLKWLDLSNNNLIELPSGLFMHTKSLETLNLSHNLLTSSAAGSLASVTSLRILRLNNNDRLGDLCSGGSGIISTPVGPSPLTTLSSLSELDLSHTSVSRICSDWRDDMLNLHMLNLRNSAIIDLNLSQLQFRRRAGLEAMVDLEQDEFQLQYTRDDYVALFDHQSGNQAKVTVVGSLVCDCNAYWTVMEFKRSSILTHNIELPKCQNINLDKVNVDTLTCNATDRCSSVEQLQNCSCTGRDDLTHSEVVFVECAHAGLTEMPRLPSANHKWRLHLANNTISNITADHVSPIDNIVELDLRNNAITRVDGQTATKLASVPLWLGGNELNCECESFGMLTALVGPKSKLQDKEKVRCTDKSSLASASLKPCDTLTPVVAGSLTVVLVGAVVVSVVLARPATLERVKVFLIWLGWMPEPPEPADEDRRFDAFVSYAHEDEEIVERLAARLESGSRPYRLCLHYRDWAPGEWIPAQIAASVRASRRTVAMVSRAYLDSGWARAEFREATAASLRDATPRLVVVLLVDPAQVTLDPELSAYVRNNTYVRWDDPWFWEKLKQALPPPRRRQKAPSPDIPLEHKSVNIAAPEYVAAPAWHTATSA